MSIPIGPPVAVQQEDWGLWTCGTVVSKGDHNHHNRSCKIQVTKTGRIITHNRQHIKPTPIIAKKTFYVTKLTKIQNRPTRHHVDHIQRHPPPHTNKTITNDRPNNNTMPYEHKETHSIQDIEGKQIEEEGINAISDNEHKNSGENIVRTRYGGIVNKPGRLMYKQ